MKTIDQELFIELDDLKAAGIDQNTVLVGNARKSKIWQTEDDPDDKRKILVRYETMSDRYKTILKNHFGDPYIYSIKQPIKKLIETDFNAQKFFIRHTYNGNKSLTPEHIKKYTIAASWLNMLVKIGDDQGFIKKEMRIPSVTKFYEQVIEIIENENVELPASYKRLRAKMKEYQEKSYSCIIDWRIGRSGEAHNSAKVADETASSVLLEMISHPNQYDDVLVAQQYNVWAVNNGRKSISISTVANYRRENWDSIVMQREGREAYYNQYSKSVKGKRPSTPLFLVESDDNHLDFFFTDWDDTSSHKHYHKYKAIVVTDSFNDYVLGYAYAREITADTVRMAYLNAITHIKEITGDYYLPHQIITDRWALATLESFYKNLGHYFPTPVGSKRRGYLEQFFGSAHWKRCMKLGTNNYTGNNVTAKTEGVNREVLAANKKEYPSVQEAPKHIDDFFFRLRTMPDAKGISKQKAWIEAFNNTNSEKRRQIDDMEFLMKLGVQRKETNRITDRGIDITIGGRLFNFDIPDQYYFEYKGCNVSTVYDPHDMSRILVTDHDKVRFIATAPHYQPRALADYTEGDRTALNKLLAAKQAHVEQVAAKKDRRDEVLSGDMVDIGTLLTSGFMIKQDRQKAELDVQRELMNGKALPLSRTRKNIDPLSKM